MPQTSYALIAEREQTTSTMKALVYYGPGKIGLETCRFRNRERARQLFA